MCAARNVGLHEIMHVTPMTCHNTGAGGRLSSECVRQVVSTVANRLRHCAKRIRSDSAAPGGSARMTLRCGTHFAPACSCDTTVARSIAKLRAPNALRRRTSGNHYLRCAVADIAVLSTHDKQWAIEASRVVVALREVDALLYERAHGVQDEVVLSGLDVSPRLRRSASGMCVPALVKARRVLLGHAARVGRGQRVPFLCHGDVFPVTECGSDDSVGANQSEYDGGEVSQNGVEIS